VRLVIRPAAREDILRQYRYYLIDKDAEGAAERFLVAIHAAIETVCRRPDVGASKALDNRALAGLRSWPVTGFPAIRVYYLSSDEELRVVRVLHGKRDIDPLLEEEALEGE
jgi:toxin ParE1/3/4